jgi:Ca2+-binding EF-hand superfamily protein
MAQLQNTDVVLFKVQCGIIASNGIGGLKQAVNMFRRVQSESQVTSLSSQQFFDLLTACGAPLLTEKERKHLFLAFDEDRNGKISINEFVRNVTGSLNPRRKQLIIKVFGNFEVNGKEAKGSKLNASHTSQKSLGASKTHAWDPSAFDDVFGEQLASEDGKVTLEEFLAFYAALSVHKSLSDDDFELAVFREWGTDNPKAPVLNETQRDWTATGGDPLVHETTLAKDAKNRSLGVSSRLYNAEHMKRAFVPNPYLPNVFPDYVTTTGRSFPRYNGAEIRKADPFYVDQK